MRVSRSQPEAMKRRVGLAFIRPVEKWVSEIRNRSNTKREATEAVRGVWGEGRKGKNERERERERLI